jgi:hypothetical protein
MEWFQDFFIQNKRWVIAFISLRIVSIKKSKRRLVYCYVSFFNSLQIAAPEGIYHIYTIAMPLLYALGAARRAESGRRTPCTKEWNLAHREDTIIYNAHRRVAVFGGGASAATNFAESLDQVMPHFTFVININIQIIDYYATRGALNPSIQIFDSIRRINLRISLGNNCTTQFFESRVFPIEQNASIRLYSLRSSSLRSKLISIDIGLFKRLVAVSPRNTCLP